VVVPVLLVKTQMLLEADTGEVGAMASHLQSQAQALHTQAVGVEALTTVVPLLVVLAAGVPVVHTQVRVRQARQTLVGVAVAVVPQRQAQEAPG